MPVETLDPALIEAIESLEVEARARWPESFAGMWGDPVETVPIHIAFTSEAEEKVAALAAGFPAPSILEPHDADHSFNELEALQARIVADRDALATDESPAFDLPDRYDLDIDQARNVVRVIVESGAATFQPVFSAAYGENVMVEDGDLSQEYACNSRTNCKYTLRAGLETEGGGGLCTTGFVVKRPSGEKQILSAAHCGASEEGDTGNRKHGNETYGSVTADQHENRVDAERHSIGNPFGSGGFIYRNDADQRFEVRGKGLWSELVVNVSQSCQAGKNTGNSCGTVRSKTFAPDNVGSSSRFVCADFVGVPGDSGAPIFNDSHEALGVLHGMCDEGANSAQGSVSYSHIEYVLDALDVNIVKEP